MFKAGGLFVGICEGFCVFHFQPESFSFEFDKFFQVLIACMLKNFVFVFKQLGLVLEFNKAFVILFGLLLFNFF